MGRLPLTLVRLAWHGVRRRPLSSFLTILAVALGVGLVLAVNTIRHSTDRSFTEAARGYDVILGPSHGSALQVVLSTLFHVDVPGGTVPWSAYEEAREDPRVRVAVPYAMGDTYRGHRVIGTTTDLFETLTDRTRRTIGDQASGRLFRAGRFEAVVGSAVAGRSGLHVGSSFQVSHGLVEGGHVHAERWTVVGVLRPTGTPHDRAIYIPIETFYAIPGHDVAPPEANEEDEEHDPDHEEHEGHEDHEDHEGEHDDAHAPHALSAVGLRLKSPTLRLTLLQEYRTGTKAAQAVLPTDEIRRLLGVVGDVNRGVTLIAWLVTAVAALSILVGLYNTIHGRRREIAVLRALGARPTHVFLVILLEALFLCLLGGVLGLVLGHGGVAAAAPLLLEEYGVQAEVAPGPDDLTLIVAVLGLGLLAGLLPAWRGLSTPVAENLEA